MVAASSTMAMTALSLHCFTKSHSHSLTASFRTLPRLTCSFSSSSSKFNISFAPSKPKPKPDNDDAADAGQLLIPWIVRGEDGNFKLQSEPPPSFLRAMATAQTGTKKENKKSQTKPATKKKKIEKEDNARTVSSSSPPKYSKAARRFYNENFKDSAGDRLSKVLAASGGEFLLLVCFDSYKFS